MDGEVVVSASNVMFDCGDHGWKVGKFGFVPQKCKKLNACQFTVCVHVCVGDMDFKQQLSAVLNGGAHTQAGDAVQGRCSQAMHPYHVNVGTGGAVGRHPDVQRWEANAAPHLLPMHHVAADTVVVAQKVTHAVLFAYV